MKLTKCSIYLLDFLQSTNEEKFFEELAKLDNKLVPNKDVWKNVPISKWKRDEFTLTTIPSELSFCEKIKIVLIQYKNISSVVMLTIEGELPLQLLESIEAQDYKDNMDTLEKYQKELWKFWKEKITSTILIKNELVNLQPLAINQLKFDEDDYERFLHHVYDSEMIRDETPIEERSPREENFISKFASKYGANNQGLISGLNITDQSLSIFSQNRAVYGHHGLDFTGLILFDVKNTKWESEVSMPFPKILAFQHYLHWLMIREQKIIPWKDKLEKLSTTINKFGSNISEYTDKEIAVLFEQKALFQTEYAAFMNECREISAHVRQQLASINKYNDWEGEHIIETEFVDPNSQNQGILKLFSTQTLDLVENLKEEYDVLKEQYEILGEELKGLVNFANSKSSLRPAQADYLDLGVENDNFQGIMNAFVSHKFVKEDQKLAISLKRHLRKNNIGGYLAEQKREFDIPINQKIRDKIDESDYLIAIITKFSLHSPSVHQEIGYALGSGCPVRIMVETEEVPGVLVKDREVEAFTRVNFEKKLDIIINNIVDKGPRKKIKSIDQEQVKNIKMLRSTTALVNDELTESVDWIKKIAPTPSSTVPTVDLSFLRNAILTNESFLIEKELLGTKSENFQFVLHTIEHLNAKINSFNASTNSPLKKEIIQEVSQPHYTLQLNLDKTAEILVKYTGILDEYLAKVS